MKNKQSQKNILPDWQQVKLGDVCKVNQGLQIPISERHNQPGKNRKVYITTQYLNGKSDTEYIEEYSNSVVCTKDDILMTRTGNSGIVVTGVEGVFHNNFFKVKPNENLDSKLLVYNLRSPYFQYKLLKLAGASTIPDLNHGDFYSIDLLLPPIPEQKRIVSILETWDNTIGRLSKKIKLKKQLKKGLMQQLLTGNKRLPGFGDNWEMFEFNDMFNVLKKPKGLKSNNYESVGEYPIVDQSANKVYSGYTNFKEYVYDYSNRPVILFGDHSRVIKFIDERVVFGNDGIKLFENKENLDINFGFYLLKNKRIPETGYNRHFKYLDISSFEIPDTDEQKAIASILILADKEINLLQQKLDEFKKQKKYLLNNLVTGKIRTPESIKVK